MTFSNASCESFMKTLKREEIYTNQYVDLDHLRSNVEQFIEIYYNRQRLHSSLGYRSPEEFEQQAQDRDDTARYQGVTMEFWKNPEKASTRILGKGIQVPSPSPDPFPG